MEAEEKPFFARSSLRRLPALARSATPLSAISEQSADRDSLTSAPNDSSRYGDESTPPTTRRETAPEHAARTEAGPRAPRRQRVHSEHQQHRQREATDWREKKRSKKKWAQEIEQKMDAARGETGEATHDRPEESPAQLNNGTQGKKRTRGGAKAREKKSKLNLDLEIDRVEEVDLEVSKNDARTEEPATEVEVDEPVENEVLMPDEEDAVTVMEVEDQSYQEGAKEAQQTTSPTIPTTPPTKNTSKLSTSSLKSQGLPAWLANPTRIPATLTSQTSASSTSNPAFSLSTHTQTRLAVQDITHLFPVQQAVLPHLLRSRYSSSPRTPPGDLLVSSATGSGKTLAYVLPILEFLFSGGGAGAGRIVPRLRALVVVPTRDLALQVKTTMESVGKGTGIRIGVVTGAMSFVAEQEMLVETSGGGAGRSGDQTRDIGTEGMWDSGGGAGRSSKVDVLTDHLKGTPGFTLRHLRFLVLDEADRLLVQDYQGWLALVLKAVKGDPATIDGTRLLLDDENAVAAHSKAKYDRYLASGCVRPTEAKPTASTASQSWNSLGFKVDSLGMPLHNVASLRHEHIHRLSTEGNAVSSSGYTIRHHTPLQKLLFSATLTRNPETIASLQLVNPTYIAVSTISNTAEDSTQATDPTDVENIKFDGDNDDDETEKFAAPPTLSEHMLILPSTAHKPMQLLHLLLMQHHTGLLVFTRSVEAAHRLAGLVSAAAGHWGTPLRAQAVTSDLGAAERRRVLAAFRAGEVACLVASDGMARGMDLGLAVRGVVNYDLPLGAGVDAVKTYVHRVGRTARAGREGTAWSFVEEREARWFKREVLGLVRRTGEVGRVKVVEAEVETLRGVYEKALGDLARMVKGKSPGQVEET
ncbi:P-loop containing nucleoside triphosphate hydrolase protein [Chytriomyces sp. MP71]|nr:P-loop containing nucleoside triphosphate hydrolase protein [Chytriomyces sp. MP71]